MSTRIAIGHETVEPTLKDGQSYLRRSESLGFIADRVWLKSYDPVEWDIERWVMDSPDYRKVDEVYPAELQKAVFSQVCKDILSKCGKYLEPERLEKAFPGLTLEKIGSYDFSNSMIRYFVLPDEAFDEFYGVFCGAPPNQRFSAYMAPGDNELIGARNGFVDTALRVRNVFRTVSEKDAYIFTRFPGETELEVAGDYNSYLRSCMMHEVLHAVGVGEGWPIHLEEGIVEAVSYDIRRGVGGYVTPLYADFVRAVSSNASDHYGWDEEDLFDAWLRRDPDKIEDLKRITSKPLGKILTRHVFSSNSVGDPAIKYALDKLSQSESSIDSIIS